MVSKGHISTFMGGKVWQTMVTVLENWMAHGVGLPDTLKLESRYLWCAEFQLKPM